MPKNTAAKRIEINGIVQIKDRPIASRLRTEGEGSIDITFENVRINGRLLQSDSDWPNGIIKQGNVTTRYLTDD